MKGEVPMCFRSKCPFLFMYVDNVFSLDDEPTTKFTLFLKKKITFGKQKQYTEGVLMFPFQ